MDRRFILKIWSKVVVCSCHRAMQKGMYERLVKVLSMYMYCDLI